MNVGTHWPVGVAAIKHDACTRLRYGWTDILAAFESPSTALTTPPSEVGTSAGCVLTYTAAPPSENDSRVVSNALAAKAAVPSALTICAPALTLWKPWFCRYATTDCTCAAVGPYCAANCCREICCPCAIAAVSCETLRRFSPTRTVSGVAGASVPLAAPPGIVAARVAVAAQPSGTLTARS